MTAPGPEKAVPGRVQHFYESAPPLSSSLLLLVQSCLSNIGAKNYMVWTDFRFRRRIFAAKVTL
jgi:hypothetical protein